MAFLEQSDRRASQLDAAAKVRGYHPLLPRSRRPARSHKCGCAAATPGRRVAPSRAPAPASRSRCGSTAASATPSTTSRRRADPDPVLARRRRRRRRSPVSTRVCVTQRDDGPSPHPRVRPNQTSRWGQIEGHSQRHRRTGSRRVHGVRKAQFAHVRRFGLHEARSLAYRTTP